MSSRNTTPTSDSASSWPARAARQNGSATPACSPPEEKPSAKPAKPAAKPPPPAPMSDQVRLDAIAGARAPFIRVEYMRAYVRWWNRAAGWTVPELAERYRALNRDYLVLQRLVDHPPAEWNAEQWDGMCRRLNGWYGQLMALADLIQRWKPPAPGPTPEIPPLPRPAPMRAGGGTTSNGPSPGT